jgi:hypothetical protein
VLTDTLLVRALRRPSAAGLSSPQWELLLTQARNEGLVARLAAAFEAGGELQTVPSGPRRHLRWAAATARKQERDARWEVACLRRALADAEVPLVLLKGAAYVVAGLPTAQGRIFSDIDILAPRSRLGAVERALILHGWRPTNESEYDQSYYRRWMHELPPLRHGVRGSVVDVHHTILPLTARPRIDPSKILSAARPAAPDDDVLVLCPADMTLHAAAHLFYDGAFARSLREVVDIASLLRWFGRDDEYWNALVARSFELDLARSLWYALRYSKRLFDVAAPESAQRALDRAAPPASIRRAMDALILRALRPDHKIGVDADVRMSRFVLYLRSHLLRMPLRLLAPHLARKAFIGLAPQRKRPAGAGVGEN